MLDIKRIRDHEQTVRDGLSARGEDTAVIDRILELDAQRRARLNEVESLKNRRNAVSKEIGARKKAGEDTSAVQAETRQLGEQITVLDTEMRANEERLGEQLLSVPNVPCADIPRGSDETANRIVRQYGEQREFAFKPRGHVELGTNLDIIDLARGARLAGSGFPLLTGNGARLQRALINFMLDMHVCEHGYREVWPPVVVNRASLTGTGQLPKLEDDMYRLPDDDMFLIPTAEVPVTNIYREEIIEEPLPLKLTAYSVCFRREAGAAGKDTRGLIRVHQFDKVEMVKFVEPETSYAELESLVGNAEDVLQRLGLTYRVLELCTGDISFAAAKCYDLELWAPGQNDWLEVSSCSNFEDFQARRAGIRYRNADRKVRYVHTLNGSGVALPRLEVAIIENYQQEDGTVVLPEALVPYTGGMDRIEVPGNRTA